MAIDGMREHSHLSWAFEKGSEVIEMEPCPWALMITSQEDVLVQYISADKRVVTTEDLVSFLPSLVSRNDREVRGIPNCLWWPGLHSTTHLNGTWKKVKSHCREKWVKYYFLHTWVCSLSFRLTPWTVKEVIRPRGVSLHQLVESHFSKPFSW